MKKEENEDSLLDNTGKKHFYDEEARVEISKMIEGYEIPQIKGFPKPKEMRRLQS